MRIFNNYIILILFLILLIESLFQKRFSISVSLNDLKYALADNFAAVLTEETSKSNITS